jgi:hypothetical protein
LCFVVFFVFSELLLSVSNQRTNEARNGEARRPRSVVEGEIPTNERKEGFSKRKKKKKKKEIQLSQKIGRERKETLRGSKQSETGSGQKDYLSGGNSHIHTHTLSSIEQFPFIFAPQKNLFQIQPETSKESGFKRPIRRPKPPPTEPDPATKKPKVMFFFLFFFFLC